MNNIQYPTSTLDYLPMESFVVPMDSQKNESESAWSFFDEEVPKNYNEVYWANLYRRQQYKIPCLSEKPLSDSRTHQLSFLATSEDESTSPFDKLDQITPKDKLISEMILYVNDLIELPYKAQLIRHLYFLLESEIEENPEDWDFSPQSLDGFLNFIGVYQDLKYPDICLSPDGLIQAQWREAQNRNLVLEFRGTKEVNLVLFYPEGELTGMFYGVSTPESVWKAIKTYGADKWCT